MAALSTALFRRSCHEAVLGTLLQSLSFLSPSSSSLKHDILEITHGGSQQQDQPGAEDQQQGPQSRGGGIVPLSLGRIKGLQVSSMKTLIEHSGLADRFIWHQFDAHFPDILVSRINCYAWLISMKKLR